MVAKPKLADLPLTGSSQPAFWYTAKRRLFGPPLVNEQLSEERLSKTLALGVLSCDGISSAAYGTEEILIELIQVLRSEEHTSELQSPCNLVCRLLLEKKKINNFTLITINIIEK